MNARDTAFILAGMRLYQFHLTTGAPLPDGITDIAMDGVRHAPTAEDIDDLCERLNMPAKTTTHKIWVAAVDHRHGTNFYAAGSKDALDADLAAYCRRSWGDLGAEAEPIQGKSDSDVIEYYFNWQAEHGDEWAVFESHEVEIPEPASLTAARAMTRNEAKRWLAVLFEYEYCAECGGDACHHTAVAGPFGLPFARCDYPPAEDDNATPHPVVAAYHLQRESAP